jgi:anti-anti-sigma factor
VSNPDDRITASDDASIGAGDARFDAAGDESRFACRLDRTVDAITARLSGDLDLAASGACRSNFDALLQSDHACVVIDLRALTFIDSTGLGLLVSLRHRLTPHRRLRVVAGPVAVH